MMAQTLAVPSTSCAESYASGMKRSPFVFAFLVACQNQNASPTPTPTSNPPPTPSMTAPVASSVASAAPSITPPIASASSAAPVAVTTTTTPSFPVLVGHVQGNHYIVDSSAPTCTHDADCALVARVTAQDGFHVNKEYPYKLAMNAAPGVTFLAPGAISSRTTGDFKEDGELAGKMTVRFRAAAGAHPLSGTFKISVCNASSCLMEQSTIAATITAK